MLYLYEFLPSIGYVSALLRRLWTKRAVRCGTKKQLRPREVTDTVQRMVSSEELHMNPSRAPQWMNQHLWPESARGPPIPRKVRHRGPGSSLTACKGVYA